MSDQARMHYGQWIPACLFNYEQKNSKLKIFYSRKFQVQRRRILTYAHMTFIALIFSAQKSEEKIVNLIFRKSQVQHRLLGHPMHVHLIRKKILSHYISWNMWNFWNRLYQPIGKKYQVPKRSFFSRSCHIQGFTDRQLAGLNVSDSTLCRNDSGPRFFISPVRVRPIQKSKTFLDAEQEIEKLRFETLNLFDNYNRKCRKHELKMEKEKCYPQLHHSE